MFDLKPLFLASWQGFYIPIDPKNNPHLCLDMIHPPAKFDVDWSKETQVIVKKLMFDARPPDHRHPHSNNQVSPCENLVNNNITNTLTWDILSHTDKKNLIS